MDARSYNSTSFANLAVVPPNGGPSDLRFDGAAKPDFADVLRRAGLRPTRQRLALCAFLFSNGDRHITAEMLHAEATAANLPVSLATVYNNLHQFTEAGLVQQIAVDGSKAFFDTNTTPHQHFFLVAEHALVDIPASGVVLDTLPEPPEGYEIIRVDVVIRLRRKQGRRRCSGA